MKNVRRIIQLLLCCLALQQTTALGQANCLQPPKDLVKADSAHPLPANNEFHRKAKIVCSYTAPILLTTYGIIAIGPSNTFYDRFDAKRDVQKQFPGFHNTADNYLQFVPAVTVFSLSLCGVKGKHSFCEQVMLYAGSMLVSEGIATGLKYSTHMLRPDGSAHNSFPSGHTTSAFTGAELLNQEYGGTSVLYSVFGYGTASATGFMRLMNNRHWMSDVLVGAGVGMLSTKAVYAIYPVLKKKYFHPRVSDAYLKKK
jgi:hypothetical protein